MRIFWLNSFSYVCKWVMVQSTMLHCEMNACCYCGSVAFIIGWCDFLKATRWCLMLVRPWPKMFVLFSCSTPDSTWSTQCKNKRKVSFVLILVQLMYMAQLYLVQKLPKTAERRVLRWMTDSRGTLHVTHINKHAYCVQALLCCDLLIFKRNG